MVTRYPNYTKIKEVSSTSQEIGRFIRWLAEVKGITMAIHAGPHHMVPSGDKLVDLLAEFYDIDLEAVEIERKQIIANVGTAARMEENNDPAATG